MAAKTGRQWLHRRTVAAAHVSHAALCTNFCNSPICMPSHARFPFLPHGRLVHLPYSPASVPPASSVSGFLSARGRGDDERGVDFARCIPRANPVFAEWTRVRRKGVARAQSRKPEEPTAVWRPAVDGFLTITREGQGGGGGKHSPSPYFGILCCSRSTCRFPCLSLVLSHFRRVPGPDHPNTGAAAPLYSSPHTPYHPQPSQPVVLASLRTPFVWGSREGKRPEPSFPRLRGCVDNEFVGLPGPNFLSPGGYEVL